MNWFARFKEDIKYEDEKVLFKKNDNTKKTRYYVTYEDEVFYYIVEKPNDIHSNGVSRLPKVSEGNLFDLKEE
jgi:hypothetical protein